MTIETTFTDEQAMLEQQRTALREVARLNQERALRGLCWLATTARQACPEATTLRLVVPEVEEVTERTMLMLHSLRDASGAVVMDLEEPESDEAEDAAADLEEAADTLPDAVTLAMDPYWNNRRPGSHEYGFVQLRRSCGDEDDRAAFEIDLAQVVDVLVPRAGTELSAA